MALRLVVVVADLVGRWHWTESYPRSGCIGLHWFLGTRHCLATGRDHSKHRLMLDCYTGSVDSAGARIVRWKCQMRANFAQKDYNRHLKGSRKCPQMSWEWIGADRWRTGHSGTATTGN